MADSLGNGAGSAGRALAEAQPSHKLKSKLERQHLCREAMRACVQAVYIGILGHANIKAFIIPLNCTCMHGALLLRFEWYCQHMCPQDFDIELT